MAIDTATKRHGALAARRLPWMRRFTIPRPDGSIAAGDRAQLLSTWRGFWEAVTGIPFYTTILESLELIGTKILPAVELISMEIGEGRELLGTEIQDSKNLLGIQSGAKPLIQVQIGKTTEV